MMMATQLGSLNAWEESSDQPFWKSFLGGKAPSGDTIGRVCALISPDQIRKIIKEVVGCARRNKIMILRLAGLAVLVLDGHESHASRKRCCAGCLERTLSTTKGEVKEYYHRHVLAILLLPGGCILLDAEPQKKGEDEVAAAMRLLTRVMQHYGRSFDVVIADALYARANFFNYLTARKKYALVVLKNEERHLLRDADGLCGLVAPVVVTKKNVIRTIWDIEGLESWEGVKGPVRVLRSDETRTIKRQLTGKFEEEQSTWWWATTIPSSILPAPESVDLGHLRWDVENRGFNELGKNWHADHVYRHEANAMLVFTLLTLLAYNMFHLFRARNLKEVLRAKTSKQHIAREMMSGLFVESCARLQGLPP